MIEMTEPYDIVVMGETYRVTREQDQATMRTCVSSDGQLRFSLPDKTPLEEVEKFIRVYALGVSDGTRASMNVSADGIRDRLRLAARRLGRAAGNWKADTK